MENFITSIYVEHSRNVKDLEIKLSDTQRQHLILTGKNASGKTSLLEEIYKQLKELTQGFNMQQSQKIQEFSVKIKFPSIEGTTASEFYTKWNSGEFLLVYFQALRSNLRTVLKTEKNMKKIELKQRYDLDDKANKDFVQYLINLKAIRSFAQNDNEIETVNNIDKWFDNLEKHLANIFDIDKLKLDFDWKNQRLNIIIKDKKPFSFYELSDGYSAIIDIATELLLRMEAHNTKAYDLEGIVLIDEIETHLHVSLQKKILPFLTSFFPKIQFIVTTHSPFVLSSIRNATICDLETRTITTDLSAYSYSALVESYFNIDEFSEHVKNDINEYEILMSLDNLDEIQEEKLEELEIKLEEIPKFLSDELVVKIQQIKLQKQAKEHA